MKVTLRRNWNAPGDHLFLSRNNPVEVDDDLLPHLPSDAIVAGSTRDDTRKKVLVERRRLSLDKPRDPDRPIDLRSDEELLAEIDGKAAPAKQAPPPTKPVTQADLDLAVKQAEDRVAAAEKAVLDAGGDAQAKATAEGDLKKANLALQEAEAAASETPAAKK